MFETTLFWILLLLCGSYIFLHWRLFHGLNACSYPLSSAQQYFSVIIAARNEEKNIRQCVESLLNQNYDSQKFEVIIVNDRSKDSTASIVQSMLAQFKNLRLITIDENKTDMPHKKNALNTGIANARFDILAFTDADCIVPKNWLSELSKHFEDSIGVVAGYSPNNCERASWIAKIFLRYEELMNSIYAAAGIGLNKAFMCTGRNFAYRKKVFTEVGGFESIKQSISGDDDLFIQCVQRKTQWKIRYMVSPESFVVTTPPSSFFEFVNQRTRHISASKFYSGKIKLSYAISHALTIMILFSFFWIPVSALIAAMVKMNANGVVISKGKEVLHEEVSIVEFFLGELLVLLYTIFIGPIGLVKKFQWKGTESA